VTIPEGFISIDEAVARFGRTRAWWYKQVADGLITGYDIPGYRGTYLRVEEAEAHIQPRPKPRHVEGTDGTQQA
jgi:hypothetical protein